MAVNLPLHLMGGDQSISPMQTLLIGLSFVFSILLLRSSMKRRRQNESLDTLKRIPGPYRFPFVGSLFALPKFMSGKTKHQFRMELAEKYGKICSITVTKLTFVFINDLEMIKEAFVSKGEIVSDRPTSSLPVLGNRGKGIISAQYGKDFKERKMLTLHSMKDFGFNGGTLEKMAMKEVLFLVERFKKVADSKTPTGDHQNLLCLAVSNVICSVVFGRRFEYVDVKFNEAVAGIRYLLSNSTYLLKKFPLLKYLPSVKAMIKTETEHCQNVSDFVDDQINLHKAEFDASSPKDFVDLCLQKSTDENGEESATIGMDHIRNIIVDMFFAGTDTTAASLNWFLLYMMRHPIIQAKCQEEIDAVPDLENRLSQGCVTSKLFPFTTAALLETQRIASIAPVGLLHTVRRDTSVGGYRLKKGSLVLANLRFLHLDGRYWADPLEFRPERWLDPQDPSKLLQHSHFVPFSIGKRRCLGENLAKAEYAIFGITLLRYFTFKVEDWANPPSLNVTGAVILSPHPYKMIVQSRLS